MALQKGVPKFEAVFAFSVPLKSSSGPQNGLKRCCFFFETGPQCRQQIGLKADCLLVRTNSTVRTKILADPEKCFQLIISENY